MHTSFLSSVQGWAILKYSTMIIANKDNAIIANIVLKYLNGAWYHEYVYYE